MNENAWQMLRSSPYLRRSLEKDNGHSLVQVPKRSGTVSVKDSPQRLHCPEVNSKAKDMENCRFTLLPLKKTIDTIFRTLVSASQLSLYGAVAEISEEYETLRERTGKPVVMRQSSSSLVLSVIKTEIFLDCDDPANKDLLLQQYGEGIEKL